MKHHRTTSRVLHLLLLAMLAVLSLSLIDLPASPARPRSTTAQEAAPFPPRGEWYTYANGDDVLTLEIEGNILWAGTRAGGLVRWDTTNGTFVQYLKPQDGLVGNTVRDIFIDANGHKWLATDHGLSVLDDKGTPDKADDEWYTYTRATTDGRLPSNRVTAVAMDKAGFLWIGTAQYWDHEAQAYVGGGLAWVDTRGTLDPSDDVWLQTYTVAKTLSRKGGDIILGLASDNITDILPVTGNRVWVATQKHWDLRQADQDDPGQWLPIYGGLSRLDHAGTPDAEDDVWKTWTCEDGPQRDTGVSCTINQLRLDANGYVWAAQRGRGVIAFPHDGDRTLGYVRFDRYDGLPTNDVANVGFGPADDPQWGNTVWFGTYDATSGAGKGVCVLDHQGTIRNEEDDTWNDLNPTGGCLTTANGLPDDRVQAILGQAGKMWMGIGGRFGVAHGISAYDLVQHGFQAPLRTADSGLPYNYITDLAVGRPGTRWEGQVWVATGNKRERRYGVGALRLNTQGTTDPADDTWTQYTKENTDEDLKKPWAGLASNSVTAIAIDGDNVWFGTQPATWEIQGRRGGQWTDGGLSVFDGVQWTIRTDANTGGEFAGLLDDRISALAIGCTGEVWIALGSLRDNSGLGINILDPMGTPHILADDYWWPPISYRTIPSNLVTGIAPDCGRGQVWISTLPYFTGFGTQGGGVARYDYQNEQWTVWTARDGLESFSEDGNEAEMRSIAVGPDGTAWAGALGTRALSRQALINDRPFVPAALNWFQNGTWANQVFDRDGWVSSIAIDQDGVVWVGTSRGGLDLDADGKADDSVPDRAVGGLKLTPDGTQWITWAPENSPLPTNDIEVIRVAPNGDVWVGTNGWGILRFHPQEPATPTPTDMPTVTVTPPPTETPTTSSPTETPTPTETPSDSIQRFRWIYMPLLASNWIYRPFVYSTAVPPTVTPTPSQTPPATSTPTTTLTPTPAPPTVTPTATQTPSPTATPTITSTPTPVQATIWCERNSGAPACRGARVTLSTTRDLYDVEFVDAEHGFVVGEAGFVARTDDGGDTWTVSTHGSATLRDIFMLNAQVGFIAGDDRTILRTTDGGRSFHAMQMPVGIEDRDEDFWAVYATSENEAWVLGHRSGSVLRWDGQRWYFDGGLRWTDYPYTGLAVPAPNQGWAIAETGHLYRYNGQWALSSWMRASAPLRAIEMLSPTEGWAAGDFGVVLRYTNGRWAESRINRPFYRGGLTGLHVIAPDHVWASASLDIGPQAEGAIFRYTGSRWEQVVHTPTGPLQAIWVDEQLTNGWAVGNAGLVMRYVPAAE